jgi:hypothetical protein
MNMQKAHKILQVLVGLPLRIARRAADMRGFHFGEIKPHKGGNAGSYVLHLLCSWRIEGPEGLITGHRDLWDPKEEDGGDENWDYEKNENLQDWKIEQLLGKGEKKSFYNDSDDKLIVESVEIHAFGDLVIKISGGYKIVTFVNHSRGDSWFFFAPGLTTYVQMEVTEGQVDYSYKSPRRRV